MSKFHFALVPVLSMICILSSGCATLSLSGDTDDSQPQESALSESPEAKMYRALQTAREKNSIVLQVEGGEKPLRVIPLPTDGKAVFMNDLVRQMGLGRRFGTPDITLFRSGGNVMDGVKMAVLFDKKTRRVQAGTDYALRPGDRITVRKDSMTSFGKMLDGLVPPVARTAALR